MALIFSVSRATWSSSRASSTHMGSTAPPTSAEAAAHMAGRAAMASSAPGVPSQWHCHSGAMAMGGALPLAAGPIEGCWQSRR